MSAEELRELDAWLAVHLFGFSLTRHVRFLDGPRSGEEDWFSVGNGHGGMDRLLSDYSTTGDGMLLVLEAMASRGLDCGLFFCANLAQHGASFYDISARPYPPLEVAETLYREVRLGTAGNAPLPECVARAAKAALEGGTGAVMSARAAGAERALREVRDQLWRYLPTARSQSARSKAIGAAFDAAHEYLRQGEAAAPSSRPAVEGDSSP